jgi:hypothetical protein
MNYRTVTLLVLAFFLAVTTGCVLLDRPPAAVSSSAAPQEFSAERAFVYVNDFAQKPHPIGTPEHDRVRDYLLAQISNLGVTPEVQRATGVTQIYQVAGSVENILARLKATAGSSDAVMLAAHYDSVPAGPGAADDGAGVAALLETIRALRAGPPLKNDVIFVFTDGEEEGMLGASAFVAEHPWTKDARVAINFEARGNTGASRLFETTADNGRLVQILAESAPHVTGSSLGYEIYKRMPNDTDMTMFKKTGAAGLNFAFIGHWEDYHTPLDNPQRLDRGSLQQQGEYALSLARAMGNADLTQLRAPDANYFWIPGGFFVRYSSTRIWPLTILAVLVFFGVAVYAAGASALTFRSVVLSLLANLGSLVVLMLLAFGFTKTVAQLHLDELPEGDFVRSVPYVLSLMAFLTTAEIMLYKLLRRKLGWHSFLLGSSALMLIFSLIAAEWFPGGSYTVLWPMLAMLLASLFVVPGKENQSLFATIAACVLALPPVLLFVPLLRGFYLALGLTEMGTPLLALVLFLLILTIVPLLEVLLTLSRSLIPLLSLCVALLLFALAASSTRYDATHPKPSRLVYALDADTRKALWASSATRTDDWTAQYLGRSPDRGKLMGFYPAWLPSEFLQHEAPALPLQPPSIEVLETSVTGDTRTLRLHVTSPRQARAFSIEAPGNEIVDAWVNDRKLGLPAESRRNKNGNWGFNYANAPADGIEVKLQAKGTGPVKLVVVDRSLGLPDVPGATFAPRPADSMPQHSGDQTMVRRSFVF